MKLNNKDKWLNDKGEMIKWLNQNEGSIIGPYLEFLGELKNWPKYLKIELKDETILIVEFCGYNESDNDLDFDDPAYEEFLEFDFIIKKILEKKESRKYKVGETIFLNYHNFPTKWKRLTDEEIDKFKFDK